MRLERLTIENFRQYYGRQRLTFSKDTKRNVTVIHGVNGTGKTSLFLAINWCLYGEGLTNIRDLISKKAISEAEPGEEIQTSVELVFTHQGERFIVSRRLSSTKQADGSIVENKRPDFVMMRTQLDGQTVRVNNPIGTMNAILPSNVRTYFLFDGEKIDNFAKPEASEEVKYAIYNVLKLEVLTRSRKHLEDIAVDYRRELKRISSGELRDLIEKEDEKREEKKNIEKRKVELKKEIDSCRRKITDIDQRLRESQDARALQQQREQIEHELEQRKGELVKIIDKIREIGAKSFISIAGVIIEEASAVLDEKRKRGEIPSNIRRQFIQDLIERKQCICGRPFELNSPEHNQLLALMNRSFPGSLEDEVLDTSANLRTLMERGKEFKETLDYAMQQRRVLLDIIRTKEEELDDVNRQLKDSPLEEISDLEKRRQEFQADIESYRLEQGTLDTRIEILNKEITELEKKIEKAKKAESRQRLLTDRMGLAQRAADAINRMYQVFADDMRQRIETETKEIFKKLIWKDSHFQDICLGPDYNLEVIDRYGLPARPDLSAGERQVLSLSFITAMSRVSGAEAPLVMDTPFGRLSSYHRNTIAEHLPDLADQLVLFVTDEELRDEARCNLEHRVGAEYRLEFDHETSCTKIIEV